jgi:hypothetical protein
MFFPKINVKNDPVRRWHRPDRHFFANGACQVLAFAFLERYPDIGFNARWIKPATGFIGHHIYVTDGVNAFDYHGLTTEQRLLAFGFKRGQRFFSRLERSAGGFAERRARFRSAIAANQRTLASRARSIPS